MVIEYPFRDGLYNSPGVNTQYFGKDAENFLESINWHTEIEYLGKECITSKNKQGIIVGFENNQCFSDYYFIIYCPKDKSIFYELANNSEFIKSIIK